MFKKRLVGLTLIAAAFILVGASCSKSSTATNNTTLNTGTKATAKISGRAFEPSTLTIKAGTTVTWTNNDTVQHTVTGGAGGPDSPLIATGGTYSFLFSTPGTYAYHCVVHPEMTGTVIVQ